MDKSTGEEQPILMPIMSGRQASSDSTPATEIAWTIPTPALELWITAASSTPMIMAGSGWENRVRMLRNSGSSFKGVTAPDMVDMPVIRRPKPSRMEPKCFMLRFLTNI